MIYRGNAASDGIAIAPAFIYRSPVLQVTEERIPEESCLEELERYSQIRNQAEKELADLQAEFSDSQKDKANIFAAHVGILTDAEIHNEISAAIMKEYKNFDWAVHSVYSIYEEMFSQMKDPLFQGRAADLRDIRIRLIRISMGVSTRKLSQMKSPCILVAHDLLPSDTASLDRENVKGIVTEIGGSTCHSAIIARGYHIPAVLGVEGVADSLEEGELLIADGSAGIVISRLDHEQITRCQSSSKRWP